jgi:hypothetical protein
MRIIPMIDSIFALGLQKDLVAQLVEHLPFKERVLGSSPSPVTKNVKQSLNIFYFTQMRTWRNW